VTDADLRARPHRSGDVSPAARSRSMPPSARGARSRERIGAPLKLADRMAALGISEMVEENMANAARVHAIESAARTWRAHLIAFGGAAPLHAARLAEKLGIGRVLVPAGAGVGSASGFLRAPVAYEVVRSRLYGLRNFDAAAINALLAEMRAEAEASCARRAGRRTA
jgi:N-methylhydantoinase A